jgi:2,3-bisphosphoglycerate-independent phosphoglycerate mutase
MPVIMIMVDGIGISPDGDSDPIRNTSSLLRPLRVDRLVRVAFNGRAAPTRADLDVPGLPQSATGHTAILTGINAARVLGRHLPGFPTSTLKPLIASHNLLTRLTKAGRRARYINAYRPTTPVVARRKLYSATTIAALSNGQRLLGLSDIRSGEALHHDFTNRLLIEQGEALPLFTPHEAGGILARMAETLDLALFEYFLTDLAGHARDPEWARSEAAKIDSFLTGLLDECDLQSTHVVLCSDHGNMEDPSIRTHTRNPVPTVVWGPRAGDIVGKIQSIDQIADQVLRLLAPDHIDREGS